MEQNIFVWSKLISLHEYLLKATENVLLNNLFIHLFKSLIQSLDLRVIGTSIKKYRSLNSTSCGSPPSLGRVDCPIDCDFTRDYFWSCSAIKLLKVYCLSWIAIICLQIAPNYIWVLSIRSASLLILAYSLLRVLGLTGIGLPFLRTGGSVSYFSFDLESERSSWGLCISGNFNSLKIVFSGFFLASCIVYFSN